MDAITPDWSSLPQDILTSIANRLHKRVDVLRFRAVCRSFRCILPHPPHRLFPRSILRNLDFLKGPNPNRYELFFPIESTLYAIQPLQNETSEAWLVKVIESKPGKIQIKDPLCGYRFRKKSPKLPESLNLLDYRVKEICRSHALESVVIYKGKAKQSHENEIDSCSNIFYLKKVIFSSFLHETDNGFAAMTFEEDKDKLSVWRIIDQKWTNVGMDLHFSEVFRDIVYHNHKFYAFTSTGRAITVDPKSLIVTEVATRLMENPIDLLVCWVESFHALLLLVAFENDNTDNNDRVREDDSKDFSGSVSEDGNTDVNRHLRFFKLNEVRREWVPIDDESELEHIVFLLSDRCLCSVSAKEFSGCRGKSMYFTDGSSDDEPDYPGEAAKVADLKDLKPKKLSKLPGYSNLFWPPPTWLN